MGLFDFLRRSAAPTRPPQAATQAGDGGRLITNAKELDDYLRGMEAGGSGVPVTPESAMRVAAVYGCVRIIAGAVATMPLSLKRRIDQKTREDASDHPLWALLRRRPNRWMTSSGFRRMMQAFILLRGNAYALKVYGVRKEDVRELIPLHPDRVTVEQQDDLTLVYKYRRKSGATVEFKQADIFHLIGLTLDGVHGLSVISYAKETIGLSLAMERHGTSLYKNATAPGAVLRAKNKLGPEGIENLQVSLEKFRGAENAGKALILEEDMAFEKLGMTASDAQFVETMGATRTDIAMFFGVPPHMLGDTTKTTSWGSGIEQQSQGFVAYTLEDWLTGWEETIDRDLIVEESVFAQFNRGGLIRGDIKTRYGAYAVGRQWGWLSANDIRALEDLNPIEGGDVYLTPSNMLDSNAPPPKEGEPADEPSQAA